MSEYYLFSHGLYFRPEARGYTGVRDEAGLFEKDYAEKYCAGSSAVTMLHKDDPKAPEFMPVCYTDTIISHLKKQRDESRAKKWVIWSNEHDAWWRPDRNGYTTLFRDAGLYTYDEAVLICAGANWGCTGDGDMDRDGKARAGQGRPMETMLPAVGCYGKENNIRHR